MEKELVMKYASYSNDEESYYKQKACIRWLKLSDANTTFFHKKVNGNNCRNRILSLVDSHGKRIDQYPDVIKEVVNYFKKLYGDALGPNPSIGNRLKAIVKNTLSTAHYGPWCPLTDMEIKNAMYSMKGSKAKASGPDGDNAGFFQHNWDIVGNEDIAEDISVHTTRLEGTKELKESKNEVK
ncbi:hypothetical protein F0562_007356 [Nyssa sinensis]|uniref:Uncharacterized protein n=1 Tax=Nyssa sinensis TaxID=561372 RepID=A0A5J5A7U5_9ASTE|nr:hypothetical protein F0562_007356 [Nyssa sinensis]